MDVNALKYQNTRNPFQLNVKIKKNKALNGLNQCHVRR